MNKTKKIIYICLIIIIILLSLSGYVYAIYKSFTLGDKAIAFTVYTESEDTPIVITNVNEPKLIGGMIPIVWDLVSSKWKVISSSSTEWYDYSHQKWANVMMGDGTYTSTTVTENQLLEESELGSMFVWIPRFEYKINYTTPGTVSDGGTISVNFISGTGTMATTDYAIHPAFRNGNGTYANGEWDSELTGFWVAKFEASSSSNNVKIIPNVDSWRTTPITNMYDASQSATYGLANSTELNSHLMKNSEWGAVAFLAYSQYGTNGLPVRVNNYFGNTSTTTSTGVAATTMNAASVPNITSVNKYDTQGGALASTTQNITGVYDMSGGGNEYIAAYYSGITATNSLTAAGGSTKYVTVYSGSNYVTGSILGDAMAENAFWDQNATGVANSSGNAVSTYMSLNKPYLTRGGSIVDGAKGAGIFAFFTSDGVASKYRGFRTVLCINETPEP